MDPTLDLLDGLAAVVWEIDLPRLNLVAISDEVVAMFGHPTSRWLDPPASLLHLVHPEDRQSVLEALTRTVEPRGGNHVEFRVIAADARERLVRSTVRAVRTGDGTRRLVGTMFDVTEWHKLRQSEHRYGAMASTEATLDEREHTHQSTFDEALIGIAHTSLDGRFLLVNRRLCDLLGYSAEELTAIDFMTISHPEDVLQDLEARTGLVDGTLGRYSREKRYRRKDGSFIWVNLSVSVHRDAAGRPAHFIAIVEDLTERKRLEQQLRQAQQMEAVGRFAGGIAHDFNNLLTAIVGYANLALEQLPGSQQSIRDDINAIRAAGKSAASLTRQLLAFSRRQILQPQVVDLNSVVSGMKGLLGRLIGEHIEVRWRLATPLDRVSADPGQIEQVVLNLALNARDAMPQGGVLSIETRNLELDAAYAADHPGTIAGSHIMLAISDTGVGLDDGVREHLFEPFYTTKGPGLGTGLGLATVYGIVKQSGGSIFVYSEPGLGTTFKIFLPRADHVGEVVKVHPPLPATTLYGDEVVLVVEDHREVRSVTRETLTRHGYTVVEAANGQAALLAMANRVGPIHLLLTDMVMPGMSCSDLVTGVRREHPRARVLYMSGYTNDGVQQRGMVVPGIAFIEKPFAPEALLRKVRDVLGEVA